MAKDKYSGGGHHISNDKGKVQQDIKGKGPGPQRGTTFGRVKGGPSQNDATPQPKVGGRFDKDKGAMGREGDGDA